MSYSQPSDKRREVEEMVSQEQLCDLWRQPHAWRQALAAVARLAWRGPDGRGWRQRQWAPPPPVRVIDVEREPALDEDTRRLVDEALEFGVVLGFSLGRTGPGGVADLERWQRLALTYAYCTSKPEE